MHIPLPLWFYARGECKRCARYAERGRAGRQSHRRDARRGQRAGCYCCITPGNANTVTALCGELVQQLACARGPHKHSSLRHALVLSHRQHLAFPRIHAPLSGWRSLEPRVCTFLRDERVRARFIMMPVVRRPDGIDSLGRLFLMLNSIR